MSRYIDMTGWVLKEHGVEGSLLTVLEKVDNPSKTNRAARWLCKCECGNTVIGAAARLRNGTRKSCGCLHNKVQKEKFIDMTGWIMKDHGVPDSKITIINKAYVNNCKTYWNCKCECGTEKAIDGYSLRKGLIKSCGCSTYENRDFIDMTGWVMREHGVPDSKLTVLERDKTVDSNSTYWKCKCDCGQIKTIRGYEIRSGIAKSCGNCDGIKPNDVYGNLTVIKQINSKNNKRMYLCKCICGQTTEVSGQDLRKGHTKTCGCGFTSKKDILTGKRINFFTVGKYLGTAGNGEGALYECICDCGNTFTARATRLRYDPPVSCGCKSATKGELAIKNILEENNINFIYNKQFFKDLISSSDNGILRYDFITLDEKNQPKLCIEYDGEQHFRPIDYFGGEEGFEKRKIDDYIKNKYAWSHNIPIVRIPYTEKNITLETIMGDQYLVQPPQIRK